MYKLVVIGAGISGLAAGIYAARSGFDVTIVEQHNIPGGLSTSWSHKYQMLFDKYRQDDCVLDIDSNNYKRQIVRMLSEDTNMKVRSDLLSIHPSVVEEVKKMWDEVFAL